MAALLTMLLLFSFPYWGKVLSLRHLPQAAMTMPHIQSSLYASSPSISKPSSRVRNLGISAAIQEILLASLEERLAGENDYGNLPLDSARIGQDYNRRLREDFRQQCP
jgi:hypothetical protein